MPQLILTLLLLTSLNSHGQTFGGIGFADIAEFAVKTRQISQCISHIEPTLLEQLKQKIHALKQKTNALCNQAKLDQAQQYAINFAKTLKVNKQLQQIPECAQLLTPTISGAQAIVDFDNNQSPYHICSF